jgi:monovalent cation:proton antiporter-2 (CPA2) family protein
LIQDIAILLLAAVLVVPLSRLAGLGAVPGFLVAGVIVGPSALALIDNVSAISQLAELGVVLLLFVIGIELRPARLWLMRRLVFGLGLLQVVVTGAVISAVAYFGFDLPFRTAVLVGPALALSSTAFALQLLSEQKMLHSEYGRTSLAVLLFQDLAVVPLLALVPLLANPDLTIGADIAIALGEAAAILLLVIAGGRYLLQPVLYRIANAGSAEVFTALAVLLVLGSALLTEHIGMSMAMGAFIAGLLIADSPFRHQVVAEIHSFRGLLLGLFFMSMGMFLDIGEFLARPLVIIGLLLALIATKILVLWGLTFFFGLRQKSGAAVALLLSQSGEFGLVLFSYTHQAELMSAGLFQQLLLVVVLSMLVTPPLASLAQRLVRSADSVEPISTVAPTPAPVVLAGFGRVGRRIGEILTMAGRAYVAIDNDSVLVKRERDNGHNVFFGDAGRLEVLRAAGVADAAVVIVTLDDFEATENLIASLSHIAPGIKILARGHDASQCRKLRTLGASLAVSENFEASLELARAALVRDEGDSEAAEALIRGVREANYAAIDRRESGTAS